MTGALTHGGSTLKADGREDGARNSSTPANCRAASPGGGECRVTSHWTEYKVTSLWTW